MSPQSPPELRSSVDFEEYLRRAGLQARLAGGSAVAVRVSDISGNINRVRRVCYLDSSNRLVGSCVAKHVPAGGTLEKYPDIRFPEDRLEFEAFYYRSAASAGLDHWVPAILHHDARRRILVQEDLAPSLSLEASLLSGHSLDEPFFEALGRELGSFHKRSRALELPARFETNPSAAANRPYVLSLPLEHPEQMRAIWKARGEQEGRSALQAELLERSGDLLAAEARALETAFKSAEERVLTHGDLHGESIFVRPGNRATVIDAELCDPGAAWFDSGMLLAHLLMLSISLSRPLPAVAYLRCYLEEVQQDSLLEASLKMAGFEMIRRVIGAANAAFVDTREKQRQALRQAASLALEPAQSALHREVRA